MLGCWHTFMKEHKSKLSGTEKTRNSISII
jgi:hypothetical protein